MSEDNKNLVLEFLDIYNRAAWDELPKALSEEYTHHNNDLALTYAQFVAGASWFRSVFPDFRIVPQDLVAEGDRVATRFTAHGTHTRSVFGEEPTGKQITLYGQVIYRFESGKIAEDWESMDEAFLRAQLTDA